MSITESDVESYRYAQDEGAYDEVETWVHEHALDAAREARSVGFFKNIKLWAFVACAFGIVGYVLWSLGS